ncbi:YbaK/EbsC family protein [uncultured Thomasclavelia sp.]|mgnify:CR=1 FL=1|uniref:YbaK/EbsC family protein n=1 Tax=uncultured Thomasclavelia sp. TaxID=3025759 RepID=UPI0025F3C312|nr:YbaK/EbsC family protein [uncultured Thomasclavelia sp.]
MSIEKVKQYFEEINMEDRIIVLEESSATVSLAAQALGCKEEHIAKTMSFLLKENPILIVMAGDAKIDNKKYKQQFHQKAKMVPFDQVESIIGHQPGGVCPFAINDNIPVYLDISLKRFEIVYPAAGSSNSAIKLTPDELYQTAKALEWIDVCKDWLKE